MKISICLLLAGSLWAQSTPEGQVRHLVADFLTAFNNLDWPAFRQCWNENPVVFYPSLVPNSTGRRTEDLAEFETAWRRQFDLIHDAAAKRGITKAPFQNIEPQDVRIDFPAPTAAVVTFHLGPNNNVLGRRMFVIVKTPAGWKITHLHASNLSLSPPN
jgi:ketosteroid isomerase-like protein